MLNILDLGYISSLKKMIPVYCIIFPMEEASMLNETLRRSSSEAHHSFGCLSPCQDTFVQLFFSASISPMHKRI